MYCKDFFVQLLLKYNVRDVFGLPGGVVLDFLNSVNEKLNAHLAFHEQSAVFSAIGYARATNGLGVAYATRGPGITNTLTAVADAFYDSVPIVIITGHSTNLPIGNMRVMSDQEIDIVKIFSPITKKCVRIDNTENFPEIVETLFQEAISGRPGPVLLDIKSDIWNQKICKIKLASYDKIKDYKEIATDGLEKNKVTEGLEEIKKELGKSSKPLLLLGDGFRGKKKAINEIIEFSSNHKIPILTGRFSQDIFKNATYYYGYIGSHGLRSGNLIFSKSDLVIAIGNRMHYPIESKSWSPLMSKLKVLRFDIDKEEFLRKIPNSLTFNVDLKMLCDHINKKKYNHIFDKSWTSVCEKITKELMSYDVDHPIPLITSILNESNADWPIICDVGNNEFWVARAYFESLKPNKLIFSKSFGAMGSALGKAIGYAHGSNNAVLCFVGDQSLLMVLQDLHYISHHQLPIKIFLLNNKSSGMIRSRQKDSNRKILQTTIESGYSIPDLTKITNAFGIPSYNFNQKVGTKSKIKSILLKNGPALIEIISEPEVEGRPHLPVTSKPQRLSPELPFELQSYLENL